jgi:predicted phage baseplate assembly protein
MPLPIPNLDDKTFNELFEESRGLIPRYAPEWTEHNLSDPGITFIDLFAWLAEMQIYFLNRVTDKNFLKFLKLLGEAPIRAKSAGADLTFELSETTAPLVIPKLTQVAATDPVSAERIIFETDEDLLVHSSTLRRVLTFSSSRWVDNTEANKTVGVFYFAFGDESGQGDQLYLGFDANQAFPKEEIKLIVNVFNADTSATGAKEPADIRPELIPSAELEWHYWGSNNRWRQLQVDDDTVALTRNGSLRFKGPADFAKAKIEDIGKNARSVSGEDLYWLRASVKVPGYELPPRVDTIAVNTVAATHGNTIANEYSSSNGLASQRIKLRNKPVLHKTVALEIQEEDGTWHGWTEVDDFDASGPEDRHFTVNLQDGLLKFGDDIHGHMPLSFERIPPAVRDGKGNIHVITYRVGGGEKGNVKVEMIREILPKELKDKVTAKNRRPAVGGVEPETLSEARSRARRNLKEITRGITTSDFETLTLKTPGIRVARVRALPQYHPKFPAIPMPGAVTVVVVPEILPGTAGRLPEPSKGLLQNVFKHLKSRSIVSTNLWVIGPEFIEVKVAAKIRVDPWMGAETVRVHVLEALRKFLDPLTGGYDSAGWPFGRPVYKSEIYQIIEGIAGVTCVDQVSLSGKSCDSTQRDRITLRKIGLVYSGEHEIAIC